MISRMKSWPSFSHVLYTLVLKNPFNFFLGCQLVRSVEEKDHRLFLGCHTTNHLIVTFYIYPFVIASDVDITIKGTCCRNQK